MPKDGGSKEWCESDEIRMDALKEASTGSELLELEAC